MAEEFRLPDLGEGVHEGRVVAVLVREGEAVEEDVPLIEVETDKASVEIPCPHRGVIEKIHVQADEIVAVGAVMFTFSLADAGGAEAAKTVASPSVAVLTTATGNGTPTAGGSANTSAKAPRRASPVVRKYARELGVDLAAVVGSGPQGRITKADVENANSAPVTASSTISANAVPAPPLPIPTRRVITTVAVSGRDGQAIAAGVPTASAWPSSGTDGEDRYGRTCRLSITQARKTIAEHMSASWVTIPQVTDCEMVDVTDLDRLRRGYPCAANGERTITMLAFVVRAVALALGSHPIFNGLFDSENNEIVFRGYTNIAIGVQTERGLMAPVIHHADQLSILEIVDVLVELAEKARTNKFAIADLQGGTYTISNAGAFGGSWFSTPIITPGQSAVLAIGRSRRMPWVVGEDQDRVEPRLIMPLSHTFDHRLADGGQEVAFLKQIMNTLGNPARLLL